MKNPIRSSICEKNEFSELLFCTPVSPTPCGFDPVGKRSHGGRGGGKCADG